MKNKKAYIQKHNGSEEYLKMSSDDTRQNHKQT